MKNAYVKCFHIEFLEFLEMVGRVAHCHSIDTEIPLHVKINRVLDEWLSLISVMRKESVYYVEIGSDSDDEEEY